MDKERKSLAEACKKNTGVGSDTRDGDVKIENMAGINGCSTTGAE